MPHSPKEVEAVLPVVFARLHLAAVRRMEADAGKIGPKYEQPLADAFHDLGLQGSGFTSTPGFCVLAEVYAGQLVELRSAGSASAKTVAEMDHFLHGGSSVEVTRHLAEARRLREEQRQRREQGHRGGTASA
jgi:hypothetical protein